MHFGEVDEDFVVPSDDDANNGNNDDGSLKMVNEQKAIVLTAAVISLLGALGNNPKNSY